MWERESSGLNGAATFNLPISTWDTIVFLAELSLCESSDRRVLKLEGGQMWISAGRSWEGESVYHFQITHPTEMRRELGTHRRENKYLFGKRVFFSFSLFFLQNHSQQTTTLKHHGGLVFQLDAKALMRLGAQEVTMKPLNLMVTERSVIHALFKLDGSGPWTHNIPRMRNDA